VKGNYYACNEIVSILLQITTDATFSLPSSAEFTMELFFRDGLTLNSVVNNCKSCKTECSMGAMVVPTFSSYENENSVTVFVLHFKGLTKNTRTVIRLDLLIECDLDCGCSCDIGPNDKISCVCPASTTPRRTHLSGSKKRYQQQSGFDLTGSNSKLIVGLDPYTVALLINDYSVNDNYYTFPEEFVLFADETLCKILSCDDYTGCFTGTVSGKIGNSYKDRSCEFVEVSCDDGDDETNDRCVPPRSPSSEPNMPPNCIHTGWDETLDGYCYYFIGKGYNCQQSCSSDDDCEEDGGCYENTECSVHTLQQENLESANSSKKQSVGSLSPLQLFGIIGGCVGFIALVAVVVLYKKFFQEKSNN
jgi:hypothetical protein